MLAQLNESPELTADGALWVWEAWSIHSVYSPCNLSSFLLLCLLPQDHREYSGPPSSVPSLRLCRRMSACSALGFLSRELVVVGDVQFRQGSMGHLLMMWFSDKPGKTDWKLSRRGRRSKNESALFELLLEESIERGKLKFKALNFQTCLNRQFFVCG